MMVAGGTVLCLAVWLGMWKVAAVLGSVLLLLLAPVAALVCALGVGAAIVIRRVIRPPVSDDDEALVAELTALGLSAGLSFGAAVDAATVAVPGDVSSTLRRAGRRDLAPGGPQPDDPAMFVVARRALATGAPLLPAVSGHAAALRSKERSRQLNAARRLPVKLLFPLALLILPGFLILTIGPAVLGSLERLGL
jgi:hypothetical protein